MRRREISNILVRVLYSAIMVGSVTVREFEGGRFSLGGGLFGGFIGRRV